MQYFEISCLDTKEADKVVREAIDIICQNINSGTYPWDAKKKWDSYGIKVMGDREIIDNPPDLPKKQPEPPKKPEPPKSPQQTVIQGTDINKDTVSRTKHTDGR